MRISDWSSDVCSSDLGDEAGEHDAGGDEGSPAGEGGDPAGQGLAEAAAGDQQEDEPGQRARGYEPDEIEHLVRLSLEHGQVVGGGGRVSAQQGNEIGRAS